jgi:penicillin-binding protein 1B
MTPVTLLPNTEVTYDLDGTPWQPKNFSPTHRRAYRLREALALSVNRPTVHLAMETGIDRIVQTAGRFGFSTPLPPYPSLALGAVDLIPIELAGAYGVFAADGVRAHPLTIRDVMGASGEILERRAIEVEQVITPAEAYLMTSLLQSVVEEGTASGLRRMGIGVPVAGKTGTTNDYRDAWFIGYTPELLVLVWVGHDDGRSINASGAAAALPIWADLARSVPHRLGGMDFVEPPGIERREVCMEDTEEASPWPCQQIREEVFLAGRGPGSPGTLPGVGTRLQRFFKGLIDGIGR